MLLNDIADATVYVVRKRKAPAATGEAPQVSIARSERPSPEVLRACSLLRARAAARSPQHA